MIPVYDYSPVKIIHFDIDKNKIENYLSTRDKLIFINTELFPKYSFYDVYNPIECRVEIRFTYRLSKEEDNTKTFGSYISEQFFNIKYVNDEHTLSQIKNLFRNSHFTSEQEFDRMVKFKGLPETLKFKYFSFPDSAIQELFDILKGKVQLS